MPRISKYFKPFVCSISCLFLLALPVSAQELPHLQAELLKMAESDQLERAKAQLLILQLGANAPEVVALLHRQEAIDIVNMQRLHEIIKEHGWPGISLVLQHGDDEAQKTYLPLLKAAFLKGDVPGQAFALLSEPLSSSTAEVS